MARLFRSGDRVIHASLGPGVVREMRSPEMVLVRFRSEYGRPYSAMVHVDALRFVARAVRDQKKRRLPPRSRPASRGSVRFADTLVGRDPPETNTGDLGIILDYANRVRHGDEDARVVLHDALLERYPKVYGALIRLAETPSGRARTVHKGKDYVTLDKWRGKRAILLDPEHLAGVEASFRNPRWRGLKQTKDAYVRQWIWLRYAFDVLPLDVAIQRARLGSVEDPEGAEVPVITYVSGFAKKSGSRLPHRVQRDSQRASHVAAKSEAGVFIVQQYTNGRWLAAHETRDLAQANRRRAALRARGYQARVREKGTGTPRDPETPASLKGPLCGHARWEARVREKETGAPRDPDEATTGPVYGVSRQSRRKGGASHVSSRDPKKRPYERHEHRVMDKRTLRRMGLQAIGRPDIAQGPLHDALLEKYPQTYPGFIRSADSEAARMGHQVEVVFRIDMISEAARRRYDLGTASLFYTRYHETGRERIAQAKRERGEPRVVTYVTPFGLKMSDLT